MMATTFPIRYFAWSPLLLLGLGLVLGLGQSLQYEPEPDERSTWTIRIALFSFFALYLFAGYGLLVARRYLSMSILTLWAFHLLAISPLLAPSCSDARRLDRLGERLGISFWDSVAGIAVIASLTSLTLVLRYRTVPKLSLTEQLRSLRWLLAVAAVVATFLATAAHWVAPQLNGALASFGTDFPGLTLGLLQYSEWWWALPVISVAALAYVSIKSEYTESRLRGTLNGAAGLLTALNLFAAGLLLSVFGSVLTMCGGRV